MSRQSDAERAFATRWRQLAPDVDLTPELEFHPERRWRFDFADPTGRVAIEIEGGVYSGGRHVRGAGFEGDAAKLNHAAALGWLVFRFTPGMIEADPVRCIEPVAELIRQRRRMHFDALAILSSWQSERDAYLARGEGLGA